jgi:spore coat polysaccharide biosynthesis protein SpsF (cytidylyltransferase family)
MITFEKLLKRKNSEEIVVHTATEEEAKKLLNELDKRGHIWFNGEKVITKTHYEVFKEDTCYDFGVSVQLCGNGVMFGSISGAQKGGCKIIEFSEIDFEDK